MTDDVPGLPLAAAGRRGYRARAPSPRSAAMKRATLSLALFAALGAGGCAGDDPVDDTVVRLETGSFTVGIGDTFTCFYLDAHSERELSVSGASGGQGLGGHHIIAYYA